MPKLQKKVAYFLAVALLPLVLAAMAFEQPQCAPIPLEPPCTDVDGDGFMSCDGDCDDSDPAVNPDMPELCNLIDDDCDGLADENAVDCQEGTICVRGECTVPVEICNNGLDDDFDLYVDCDDRDCLGDPACPLPCQLDSDCALLPATDCSSWICGREAFCVQQFAPEGSACDNGDYCTGRDACDAQGHCLAGTAVNCNDGNICTEEFCDPQVGCVYSPLDCDDQDGCTVDSCDPQTGCQHAPVVCQPGDACHVRECNPQTGQCEVSWVDCDDGEPCTSDHCDSVEGCYHLGLRCGTGEICVDGFCVPW